MFTNWLASASAAGIGAFCGALGAYFLARRNEDARKKGEYLCLLLVVYEDLELLYKAFTNFDETDIIEQDGEPHVVFDTPLPSISLTSEQMQSLFALSPDLQMPSTLIHVQNFLKEHAQRVAKQGSDVLPLGFVQRQVRQLEYMLLSVETQYKQATNAEFPLDTVAHMSPQK